MAEVICKAFHFSHYLIWASLAIFTYSRINSVNKWTPMCYRLNLILCSLNTKVLWFLAHILSDFRIFFTFPIHNLRRFLNFEYFVRIYAFSKWISTNGHVKFKLLFVYNCNETRTSHSPLVVYFNISIIGRAKLLLLLCPLLQLFTRHHFRVATRIHFDH